jgi:hypothetical protein
MLDRFATARRGDIGGQIMPQARIRRAYEDYVPTATEANAASMFRGKVQQYAARHLQRGRVLQTTMEVVAADIAHRWRPKTQEDKCRAARNFQAFLTAVGMAAAVFPANEVTPDKTKEQRGREEDLLTAFAMHRASLGQCLGGIATMVSHVRTWYEHTYDEPLGTVGWAAKMSPTSKYIKSMQIYYPIKDNECKKRAPLTQEQTRLMVKTARQRTSPDVGVAILVAFAGLFRMGELTATDQPYNPVEDMAESDLRFIPSFWTAHSVVVEMGRSKADQDGKRAKLRPRVLPVDDDDMSPGGALRMMIAERHGLRKGTTPMRSTAPLFQDGRGGQLKQSAVLTYMRTTLEKHGGKSKAEAMMYGTHSCRIGGATRLFELGATADVMKNMGGWSSEAWKGYVRMQQAQLMTFAR